MPQGCSLRDTRLRKKKKSRKNVHEVRPTKKLVSLVGFILEGKSEPEAQVTSHKPIAQERKESQG